jgi:hypothetical protein
MAIVSVFAARMTGTPSGSAWNCILHQKVVLTRAALHPELGELYPRVPRIAVKMSPT